MDIFGLPIPVDEVGLLFGAEPKQVMWFYNSESWIINIYVDN